MPPKKRGTLNFLRKGRRRRVLPQRWKTNRVTEGAALFTALISLYGLGKLTAKDFCILCYHAWAAHVQGGDFELYAYPPNKPSTRYQAHLDRVMPPTGALLQGRLSHMGQRKNKNCASNPNRLHLETFEYGSRLIRRTPRCSQRPGCST